MVRARVEAELRQVQHEPVEVAHRGQPHRDVAHEVRVVGVHPQGQVVVDDVDGTRRACGRLGNGATGHPLFEGFGDRRAVVVGDEQGQEQCEAE